MSSLSHFDESGASRMVDVGEKAITHRIAVAEGFVTMKPETLQLIQNKQVAKGDVFEVARLAGIMGSKHTSTLIPLCHPLAIEKVSLSFEIVNETTVRIEAQVSLHGKTGVEMEALTAVTVAALTVYDMCKAADREMTLGPFQLREKQGGKSGYFTRDSADDSVDPSK